MAKLFANSGYPDQTPQNAAFDLGLHCLPVTLLRVSRLQWVKNNKKITVVYVVVLINYFQTSELFHYPRMTSSALYSSITKRRTIKPLR